MEEEFEGEPRFGGHDFVFVDELSPGQTCPVCLLAMRSPVQTVCGHRFCESCLLGTFREGHDQVCPQDRNPIREDGGFFRDVAWGRDILSLRVKCKKSETGCEWTGQLRHYEEHFNLCEYEDVTCDDCNEEMQRRLLHKHATSECHNRIVQCEYCEEEFAFWLTESHKHNECTRFPLDCPQECGVQEIPREEVESHVRDDCVMTMVVCPYEGAGCTFHDKRSNLNDHLDALNEEHLRKTYSKLLKTTERLNELEAVEGQIEELQTDKESMKRLLDSNSEEISDLKLSEKKLEVENLALKKDLAALQKQLEEVKLTAADDKEEVRLLKAEYNALKKDVEELRRQFKEVKCTSALESMPTKSDENTSYNSVWDLPKYDYRANCVANDTREKHPCEANPVKSIEGALENNEVKQRMWTEGSPNETYSKWDYKYHESENCDSAQVEERPCKERGEGHVPVCPQDRSPIPEDGGLFRDVAWEREILSLRVKCKKSERGCDWTGQLRYYEEHFIFCEYEDITCDDCNEEMQRRLLDNHTASECPNRIVQCEHCEMEFAFLLTEFHEDNECTRFPLDCPQKCGVQEIPREEVEFHLRDDCMMTMVVCPYEGAGCTFHDKRSNLKNHLEIASEEHLSKTWSQLLMTTERLNKLEGVEGQIEELKTNKESMKGLLEKNSREINDLRLSEKKLEVENLKMQMEVAELRRHLEEVKLTAANDQEEINSLKRLVLTIQTKYQAIEEKQPLQPTSQLNSKLARLSGRKPKSSRQEQSGQKEKPFRERSGSSRWYRSLSSLAIHQSDED